jgi:hypothetical protein
LQLIGVESVAYQAALAQQAMRIPGLAPVLPIFAPGKKTARILGMAPLFKIGKIRIKKEHYAFIDEWINYDSQRKDTQDDDCLDAVEIALRTAGALLPTPFDEVPLKPPSSWEEWAAKDRRQEQSWKADEPYDEHLGDSF